MIWYLVRTIKETCYNKKFLISSLSILTLVVIGTMFIRSADSSASEEKKTGTRVNFGVVDYDESIYSKMIVQYFQGTESFMEFASIVEGAEEEIKMQFEQGELSAYLVIPNNFADSLMYGENTKIRTVINANNTMVSVMLRNMLDSYDTYITNVQKNSFSLYELMESNGLSGKALDKANFDTSVNLISKALKRDDLFEKHEVTAIPHTPIYKYYVWALASLLILYSSVLSGVTLLRELSVGTFARLRIIGHSVGHVLAGVLFSHVILWSCLISGCMKLICSLINIELTWSGYAFLWFCIFAANTCFCLIACVCNDKKTFMVISNFGLLIMGILGGVVFPISVMPYHFIAYAKASPNYWIITRLIGFSNQAPMNLGLVFGGLLMLGLAFYVLTLGLLNGKIKMRIGGEYENG